MYLWCNPAPILNMMPAISSLSTLASNKKNLDCIATNPNPFGLVVKSG